MYSIFKIQSLYPLKPKLNIFKKYKHFKLILAKIHVQPSKCFKYQKINSHGFFGDLEEISNTEFYGYSLDEGEDDLTDEQVDKLLIEMKEKEKRLEKENLYFFKDDFEESNVKAEGFPKWTPILDINRKEKPFRKNIFKINKKELDIVQLTKALTKKKKEKLIAQGMSQSINIIIGRRGIEEGLLNSLEDYFKRHNLVAVRIIKYWKENVEEITKELEEKSKGAVLHRIGRRVVLYRPKVITDKINEEKLKDKIPII